MFAGCLMKELDASKGYLGDSNVADWSSTVEKVKRNIQTQKLLFQVTENMETKNYLIIQLTYSRLNKKLLLTQVLRYAK